MQAAQPEVMYNLTVETAHTFFVGDERLLVHNECPGNGPPLRIIHDENSLSEGSLSHWEAQDTADIVDSLRPGSAEPLQVKPDGTVVDGNTRLTVLQERGFDINALPRTPYVGP